MPKKIVLERRRAISAISILRRRLAALQKEVAKLGKDEVLTVPHSEGARRLASAATPRRYSEEVCGFAPFLEGLSKNAQNRQLAALFIEVSKVVEKKGPVR